MSRAIIEVLREAASQCPGDYISLTPDEAEDIVAGMDGLVSALVAARLALWALDGGKHPTARAAFPVIQAAIDKAGYRERAKRAIQALVDKQVTS